LQEELQQLQENQQLLQHLTLNDSQHATTTSSSVADLAAHPMILSGCEHDVDATAATAAAAAADPSVAWQLPPAPAPVRVQSDSTRSNSGSNGSAAGSGSAGVAGGVELVRPVLWPMQVRQQPAVQSYCPVAELRSRRLLLSSGVYIAVDGQMVHNSDTEHRACRCGTGDGRIQCRR
jgi:hypothetical protein